LQKGGLRKLSFLKEAFDKTLTLKRTMLKLRSDLNQEVAQRGQLERQTAKQEEEIRRLKAELEACLQDKQDSQAKAIARIREDYETKITSLQRSYELQMQDARVGSSTKYKD